MDSHTEHLAALSSCLFLLFGLYQVFLTVFFSQFPLVIAQIPLLTLKVLVINTLGHF